MRQRNEGATKRERKERRLKERERKGERERGSH